MGNIVCLLSRDTPGENQTTNQTLEPRPNSMSYRALQFTPCNTGATPQFGFRSHETGGTGLFWIWADLSLIYLKGFSPLRTNRDSARKRKPGAPFAGLIASNHFAGKKHFTAAIGRSIRGNTVSLSDRKAASVGGLFVCVAFLICQPSKEAYRPSPK